MFNKTVLILVVFLILFILSMRCLPLAQEPYKGPVDSIAAIHEQTRLDYFKITRTWKYTWRFVDAATYPTWCADSLV